MTQDEIRRLLGGYASNALSADERRLLFEAALEDQELFNALQGEDALRELLADPVTREQVRRALETSQPQRRPGFWSRRWIYGVVIPAGVAVILVAIMNRANAPRLIAPIVREAAQAPKAAQPQLDAKLEPPPSALKKQAASKQETAANKPAPVPAGAPVPAAASIQLESARSALPAAASAFRAAPSGQIPDAIRRQFAAGFPATMTPYQGPLVQYAVVRSGPAGDGVQVKVTAGIPGYVALYRVDAAGNSMRVYPPSDPATLMLPNSTIQIPGNPLKIAAAGERLRLVVVRAAPATAFGQLRGTVGGFVGGVAEKDAAPSPEPPAPLVVDIPLGPN